MQKLVKTGKNTEITNNLMSMIGLIEENMEPSHIHLPVYALLRNTYPFIVLCQNNKTV
jgi:hypothetical protein